MCVSDMQLQPAVLKPPSLVTEMTGVHPVISPWNEPVYISMQEAHNGKGSDDKPDSALTIRC